MGNGSQSNNYKGFKEKADVRLAVNGNAKKQVFVMSQEYLPMKTSFI